MKKWVVVLGEEGRLICLEDCVWLEESRVVTGYLEA